MNYSRIALAALGATVVYFVLGGILFSAGIVISLIYAPATVRP
jgi:hypothetical protein